MKRVGSALGHGNQTIDDAPWYYESILFRASNDTEMISYMRRDFG